MYRPPPSVDRSESIGEFSSVSLLIPARNEASSIAQCLDAARESVGIHLEIVVLDDHSEDETALIVREIMEKDPRVRLETGPELPAGWCGKQHACHILGGLARNEILAFIDADVTLTPDGLARMSAFLNASRQARSVRLVSGFPQQETGTILEKMIIPLIHFLLLGFLPMGPMRRYPYPGLGAGCGQLFLTDRGAYHHVGGHAAVKSSLHDGLTLPRAYRQAGFMSDLCDATDVCRCRMYRSAGELWNGLAKNAREGLGAPSMLVPASLLLLGGQVLPFVLLACGSLLSSTALLLVVIATALAYFPRMDAAWRFRQSWLGAILHPLGVLALVAIQWYANIQAWRGRPVGWKGRPPPARADTDKTHGTE